MKKTVTIIKKRDLRSGVISLPTSKSLSNRLLILQFLSGKAFAISGLSNSDDTILLASLLKSIRRHMHAEGDRVLELDARNAGTVLRFLTAVLAMVPGKYYLHGNERMHSRPIKDLVEALMQLGADIRYAGAMGYPPLEIEGKPMKGGKVQLDTGHSSQFLTALMLIGPFLPEGMEIKIHGEKLSWPYCEMTMQLLSSEGVEVSMDKDIVRIFPKMSGWMPAETEVDWSSASFWYELVAMDPSVELFFPHLTSDSLQGDRSIKDLYRALGVVTRETASGTSIKGSGRQGDVRRVDLSFFPDLVIPFVTTCCVRQKDVKVEGINHLRFKESDRLKALSEELERIGCIFSETEPGTWSLQTAGLDLASGISFMTHDDHRMAMSLAMLAAPTGRVTLDDESVVSKSYPGFWNDMQKVGFELITP